MVFKKGNKIWLGVPKSEEHKKHLSEALKGKKLSKETRQKISKSLKGRISWNKGKEITERHKDSISRGVKQFYESQEGRKVRQEKSRKLTGKPLVERHGKEIADKIKRKLEEGYKKYIEERGCCQKGKKHTKEAKKKMSESHKGHKPPKTAFKKGKLHPMFNNWASREPYGVAFSPQLKERIRKRDKYRCQQCFRHQDELYTKTGRKYKLTVHHIDYNKKNNKPENLLSLCRNCHSQTNFKRNDWTDYFQNKLGVN